MNFRLLLQGITSTVKYGPPSSGKDQYAVKVVKKDTIVGYDLCNIPKWLSSAIFTGCVIKVELIWKLQNKRNNGIEVPCKYTIKGPVHNVDGVETIIDEYIGLVYKP